MKTVTIGDLLTDEQAEAVRLILLRAKDDSEATKELKAYLIPLRVQLEANGVLPEYLAYAILATAQAKIAEVMQSIPKN